MRPRGPLSSTAKPQVSSREALGSDRDVLRIGRLDHSLDLKRLGVQALRAGQIARLLMHLGQHVQAARVLRRDLALVLAERHHDRAAGLPRFQNLALLPAGLRQMEQYGQPCFQGRLSLFAFSGGECQRLLGFGVVAFLEISFSLSPVQVPQALPFAGTDNTQSVTFMPARTNLKRLNIVVLLVVNLERLVGDEQNRNVLFRACAMFHRRAFREPDEGAGAVAAFMRD